MAKFRIRMKLQGLELEVEGNREDVPLITENISDQVAGLLKPASNIVEGEIVSNGERTPAVLEQTEVRKKPRRKRAVQGAQVTIGGKEEAVDWTHDPSKFGVPKQQWTTAEKALWVLYVLLKVKSVKELSAPSITATFNKHFPQAGVIRPNNVSRDLGKAKLKSPAEVSEDRAKSPSVWFLTDAGIHRVEKLIQDRVSESRAAAAG